MGGWVGEWVGVGGGGWGVWLQEGNDILVIENLLSINLLRRITIIDLCKKNSYLPIIGLDHV